MATTTYLSIEIPDVGADNNTWGTITNAAWNSFDACFRQTGNGTSVGINIGSGNTATIGGTLTAASGAFIVPTSASPAQTALGSVVFNSSTEAISVGNGSGRTIMATTDTAQTLSLKTLDTCTSLGYFRAASGFAVDDVYSIGSVAAAGTIAVDVTTRSSFQTATVTGTTSNLTITGPSGRGVRGDLFVSNTSGSNHTITVGAGVYTVAAITSILIDAGKKACISFVWDGTQAWIKEQYFVGGAVDDIYPPQSSSATLPS